MNTISDRRYDEYFGFTHEEVKQLLKDAGLEKQSELVQPENFRENTSGNSIIRQFLERTEYDITEKLSEADFVKSFHTALHFIKKECLVKTTS